MAGLPRRGRTATYIRDDDGREIHGLCRSPAKRDSKGNVITYRYYAWHTPANGRTKQVWFGSEQTDAIRRFHNWKSNQSERQIKIVSTTTFDLPKDTAKVMRQTNARTVDELPRMFRVALETQRSTKLFELAKVDESAFWGMVRKKILSDPNLAAQKTGIPEIGRLSSLPKPENLKLADIGTNYLLAKSKTTVDNKYKLRIAWKEFLKIVQVPTLNDLTPELIAQYHLTIHNNHSGKNNTIRHRLQAIKTILRYARKGGKALNELGRVLQLTEMFEYPKKGVVDPYPISRADFHKLLKVADQRMKCVLLVALNCAYYPVDVCGLRFEHVDLKKKTIVFRREKTGIVRAAVLWRSTCEALAEYMPTVDRSRTEAVFPNGWGVQADSQIITLAFNDLKAKAGIKDPKLTFSSIRDGSLTAAQVGGAQENHIKILAGHKTGMGDHYILRHPKMMEEVCRSIHKDYFGSAR